MIFPAWEAFETEGKRVKMLHVRVYRCARARLDFRQPRKFTVSALADAVGDHKSNVSRSLRDLLGWGYLVEHPRDEYGARYFTLAWSVDVGVVGGITTPNAGRTRGAA